MNACRAWDTEGKLIDAFKPAAATADETDGAIAAFGRDLRRLRPNIVIGEVEALAERNWQGRQLRIGGVTINLADLRVPFVVCDQVVAA